MEIHKTTNRQLNDLLQDARQEKPVLNVKDVEKIITDGKYVPASGGRGLHIGLNNLIVVCGIVVSSFLAYMALKVDQGELAALSDSEYASPFSDDHNVQNALNNHAKEMMPNEFNVQGVETGDVTTVDAGTVPGNSDAREKTGIKDADRVRPKNVASTLLASSDKSILVLDDDAGNKEELAAAGKKAKASGEYLISFNYNGQDVRMKMVGDEVAELYIDDQEIASAEFNDFDDILSEGKNYLIGNTHADENASSVKLIKYFDTMLRDDQVLTTEAHYQFRLSSSRLIVNGENQPDELFKKYKGLYESRTGKTITPGSVYEFEHGAKSN